MSLDGSSSLFKSVLGHRQIHSHISILIQMLGDIDAPAVHHRIVSRQHHIQQLGGSNVPRIAALLEVYLSKL